MICTEQLHSSITGLLPLHADHNNGGSVLASLLGISTMSIMRPKIEIAILSRHATNRKLVVSYTIMVNATSKLRDMFIQTLALLK